MISQAVELAGRASGGHHARMAKAWSDGCSRGATLAEQLQRSSEPPMAVALVHAGERSGRLPEVAISLADYYDHLIVLRDLVIARLWYPMLLLHAATFVPGLILVFALGKPMWWLLIGPFGLWAVIGAVVCAYFFTRASGLLSRMAMAWPLSIVFQPFVEMNTFQVLRLAYMAGMLTPDALELGAGGCVSGVMEVRLHEASTGVRQGALQDLTAALVACGMSQTPIDLIRNGVACRQDRGDPAPGRGPGPGQLPVAHPVDRTYPHRGDLQPGGRDDWLRHHLGVRTVPRHDQAGC